MPCCGAGDKDADGGGDDVRRVLAAAARRSPGGSTGSWAKYAVYCCVVGVTR